MFKLKISNWLLLLTVVSFVCLFHYCLSLPFNVDVCGVLCTYGQISSRDSITQKIAICYLLPYLELCRCLCPSMCVCVCVASPHITLALCSVCTVQPKPSLWFTAQFSQNFGYVQLIFYSRPRRWWRHNNTEKKASKKKTRCSFSHTLPLEW